MLPERMASTHVCCKQYRPYGQRLPQNVQLVHICRVLKHSSTSSRCTAISVRQQQQQLTVQLSEALQQHQQQSDQIIATVALVDQGVVALLGSPDWQQLQQSFQHAARQYNAAATLVAAAAVQQSAQLSSLQTSASSSHSTRALPAAAGRSSPWGFALRQPSPAQAQPQPSPSLVRESGNLLEAAAAAVPKQRQQQQWDWASVQELVVLGTGSIGKLRQCSSTEAHEAPQRSSRLGFRFFQLVVAKALQASLLSGLAKPPSVFDPDFDEFDQQLLAALGFEALAEEFIPHAAEGSSMLVYMPCCPRDLYSTVLAANRNSLQQLAVFGTSMRSLADSGALVEALTSAAAQQKAPVNNQLGIVTTALTAAEKDSAGANSSCSVGRQVFDVSNQAQAGSQAAGIAAAPAAAAATFVEQAYQQGAVIEVPCPDCAAHGVGVAVHLFGKQVVQA